MTINILDKDVVTNYKDNLKEGEDGIILEVYNSEQTQLYSGTVWTNEQYEYDADKGGEYKVCVSLTNSMFIGDMRQIKTQVKFASEFHRDKKSRQEDGEEVHKGKATPEEEASSLK